MRKIIMTALAAVIAAGITVPLAASGASAAPAAHRHARQLPGYVHWRYVPGSVRDLADCGNMHGRRAIYVWTGDGDTAVLVCPGSHGGPYLPS